MIAFHGGFHGRTLLGMSLTGKVVPYKAKFGPMAPGIWHVPFPVAHKGITVEDDVWIGSGSVVTDGVTIGKGSVIAAGSVVTRDVPPYTVAAGIPARVIREIGKSNRIHPPSEVYHEEQPYGTRS